MDTAFKPLPYKVICVTIDEEGNNTFLKTDSADCFLEQGETITRRASHVEPVRLSLRLAFSLLRTLFPDTGAVAAWTRTWGCEWRINTKPVGGPVLTWAHVAPSKCAAWMDDLVFTTHSRQEAIDAEIVFLNDWFLRR